MKASPLNEMKGLGFELSGRFLLDRKKVKPELRAHKRERGVYAFVVGEAIKYVGETANNLQERANQYAKPSPSQTTNVRVNRLLKKEARLQGPAGPACEIWFLPDRTIEKGRLYLDLKGTRLEGVPDISIVKRTLISRWDPNWNRR